MNKLFLLSLTSLLFSCSNNPIDDKSVSSDSKISPEYKFEILKEEKYATANTAEETAKLNEEGKTNVCQIQVKLPGKFDKTILQDIATKLRKDRTDFERLYIWYYLPDRLPDASGNGAWAWASFTPDLAVEILGSTNSQDKQTATTSDIDGEIFGKWRSEKSLMGASLILYKNKKGQLIMKTTFKDGKSMTDEIKQKKKNGKKIYDDGNSHGEYYLLEDNGNLGLYGKDGKFDEAGKIN